MAAHLLATIGVWYASELVRLWGGDTVKVPVVVGPDHPLSVALGCFGAGRLCAVYGLGQLEVPTSLYPAISSARARTASAPARSRADS